MIEAVAPKVGAPLVVSYQIGDGIGALSLSTLTITAIPNYVTPPTARDVTAEPPTDGVTDVTVDVIGQASTGAGDSLSIVSVGTGEITRDHKIKIPLIDRPQLVPYELRNSAGGTAVAVVFVPPLGSAAAPYANRAIPLKAGGGSAAVADINSYLASSRQQVLASGDIAVAPGRHHGDVEGNPADRCSNCEREVRRPGRGVLRGDGRIGAVEWDGCSDARDDPGRGRR